jgi:Na+-translocating ferredoxin:NAD+ oxidoreductase RnfG subunit
MKYQTKIIVILGLIAVLVAGYVFVVYTYMKALTTQQFAIINALGSAGVLEQDEAGDVLVNRVVRYKDLPQE